MSKIKVIEPHEAEGELKEIYNTLTRSRGKIAEVHKIQSLHPESILKHMDLYMTLMYGKSPLKRAERELLGVIVSIVNQCEYCYTHHLLALKHYWKESDKLAAVKGKDKYAVFSEREKKLCILAEDLTAHPEQKENHKLIDTMKVSGFSDREILDTVLIISYFNFVNRIILGLDVSLESNPGGYNY